MKIGLALSGGGIKGAAHIGVIKALEENNIKIDVLAGTSSGSIVAVLYAMGYTIDEIFKLFKEFAKVLVDASPMYFIMNARKNKNFLPEGTRSGENIEIAMRQVGDYKRIKNFKQLKMPIAIPAVDIKTGKEFVFTNNSIDRENYIKEADISKAVRASCSFPGIYAPCKYKGYKFLDGGVLNNIPADEAKALGADKVISIRFPEPMEDVNMSMYTIILRALNIMIEKIADEKLKDSDYILDLDMGKMGILDIRKLEYCYEFGYKKTIENISIIKKIIHS